MADKIARDVHEENLALLETMDARRRATFLQQQQLSAVSPGRGFSLRNSVIVQGPRSRRASDLPSSGSPQGGACISERAASMHIPSSPATPFLIANGGDAYSGASLGSKLSFDGHGHLAINTAEYAYIAQAKATANKEERDVEEAVENEFDVDIEQIVWAISDALRYTVIFDTSVYTKGVESARSKLVSLGLDSLVSKNYWSEGDGYQGVNDVYGVQYECSPTGILKVEVQFHTPESFVLKMDTHVIYEEYRETKDPQRKIVLWKQGCMAADAVPVPTDVMRLPVPKTKPEPLAIGLYIDLVISRALKIRNDAVLAVESALASSVSLINAGIGGDVSKVTKAVISSQVLSPSAVELRLHHEMHRLQGHREAIATFEAGQSFDRGGSFRGNVDSSGTSPLVLGQEGERTKELVISPGPKTFDTAPPSPPKRRRSSGFGVLSDSDLKEAAVAIHDALSVSWILAHQVLTD